MAVFLLLGIPVIFLSPQKALAKDSYGLTWTVTATPSAVVVDTSDNIYYAGYIASHSAPGVDLNPLPSHLPTTDYKIATTGGIFLTKIDSGLAYVRSYLIEADDPKVVNGQPTSILLTKMATDSANNVYLLGSFNGNVNFNTTGSGPLDFHSSNGETWQFLTEIKANGDYGQTFLWQSPYLALKDVAFDKNNNVYLAGRINNSTGGDITVNLDIFTGTDLKTVPTQEIMAFYVKLNAGSPYTYGGSQSFTNTAPNHLELDHIALDSTDNVFLLGIFSGTVNFDGTGGTDNQSSQGGSDDLYLAEYDPGGAYLQTYAIGGSGNEAAGTLAVDHDNNIYYTGALGNVGDTINFDPIGGTDPATATYANQPFLTKLTDGGATYSYTRLWQADGLTIEKIAFQDNSLVYLTGESPTANPDTDYDPTTGIDSIHGHGGNDAFMTVLHSDGAYDYSYVWGGLADEKAPEGALDSFYDFYVAGSTQSFDINFDPVTSTDPQTFTGGENGYITQFSFIQYVPPTPPVPPADNEQSNDNSNSSSSSNSAPSACGGSQPLAPSIFQIWATKTNATMHFVPSQSQENSYTISYGPYSDAGAYNTTFNYSNKSGAIPYTINALSPGTVYYFKVRANNGCMPGAWSNTLSLRTAYSVGVTSKAYSYNSTTVNNVILNNNLGGSCSQYTVLPGDSFWSIAKKLLGAGGKYFQLWNANKLKFPSLNSSSIIRTGWVLSVGC